jgi:hypothetical protein
VLQIDEDPDGVRHDLVVRPAIETGNESNPAAVVLESRIIEAVGGLLPAIDNRAAPGCDSVIHDCFTSASSAGKSNIARES